MELPRLQKIYESHKEEGLEIIAIEINNDREGADTFIAENNLTFRFGSADRDFVKTHFNTARYPNSFLVGRDGEIKQHHIGFKEGDEVQLEQDIIALLFE